MKFLRKTATSFALLLSCSTSMFGESIVYRTHTGDISIIDVNLEDSFKSVLHLIETEMYAQELYASCYPGEVTYNQRECLIDFMSEHDHASQYVSAKNTMRNYSSPLSANEKKEITYIVDTLGNSSLIAIATAKSSIEKSGKDVEHVHPLQFLLHIFSSEKLKAAIHNMQNRSWIWGRFFKGIKGGLEEEANRNNLLQHLQDFSNRVQINSKLLYPLAERHEWKEFVDVLLKQIPRSENSGRYDM